MLTAVAFGLAACSSGADGGVVSTTAVEYDPGQYDGRQPTTAVATTARSPPRHDDSSRPELVPQGFESGIVEVRLPDGRTIELCVLLATTSPQREQGLMEVTGLGRYAGMLFAFPAVGERAVLHAEHPHPAVHRLLRRGRAVRVGHRHAALPWQRTPRPAPSTAPTRPYLNAIEVPLGDLNRLGIGPGSVLTVTDRSC